MSELVFPIDIKAKTIEEWLSDDCINSDTLKVIQVRGTTWLQNQRTLQTYIATIDPEQP